MQSMTAIKKCVLPYIPKNSLHETRIYRPSINIPQLDLLGPTLMTMVFLFLVRYVVRFTNV